MTYIIYRLQQFIDFVNTLVANKMTERWYQYILEDVAEEYKQEKLKELKAL